MIVFGFPVEQFSSYVQNFILILLLNITGIYHLLYV